ncbi:MAG: PKD domain-containing protein [Actinomycetota bacterium]
MIRTGIVVAMVALALATAPARAEDGEDPTPTSPPPGTVSTGPWADHLLHIEVEVHLYDEDAEFPVAFDPGPDESCVIHGDLWIEMSSIDGRRGLSSIEPPRPGRFHSVVPGPFVDGRGRLVEFSCAEDVSVCWSGSAIDVLPDGTAELDLEVQFYEGGSTLFSSYIPCRPGDEEDRTTISLVAPADRIPRCNRGPIESYWQPTLGRGNDDGATIRACLSNHPLDEISSMWGRLQSGTSSAIGSLEVYVDGEATAYGGIDSYRWHWGDGTSTRIDRPGLVRHEYTTPGEHRLELTAIPNRPGMAAKTIEVARIFIDRPAGPPTAIIDAPVSAEVGEPILFDAAASLPGDDRNGAIAEYRWNFGDGTYVNLNAFIDSDWSHTYTRRGVYTVTLTAMAMNLLEHRTTHLVVVE